MLTIIQKKKIIKKKIKNKFNPILFIYFYKPHYNTLINDQI